MRKLTSGRRELRREGHDLVAGDRRVGKQNEREKAPRDEEGYLPSTVAEPTLAVIPPLSSFPPVVPSSHFSRRPMPSSPTHQRMATSPLSVFIWVSDTGSAAAHYRRAHL